MDTAQILDFSETIVFQELGDAEQAAGKSVTMSGVMSRPGVAEIVAAGVAALIAYEAGPKPRGYDARTDLRWDMLIDAVRPMCRAWASA